MEISRERFLDDSRRYHLTLSVRSRTTEMHSLLSGLSADQRDAVAAALARALDEIQTAVAASVLTSAPS
jgi:truncated hemoglobin YjbI